MSDLIDLKSPDGKAAAGAKLASPLIPAPKITTTDSEDVDNAKNTDNSNSACLNFVKRNSLDNNPFDNAHHKIVEYTRKQEDPFELALEKALTYDNTRGKNSSSRSHNVEFKDDFTPKRRRYSDILKMNKTLDDSAIQAELNAIAESPKTRLSPSVEGIEIQNGNKVILDDCSKTNVSSEGKLGSNLVVPRLCVESVGLETSILNNSAMNDSLTESSGSADDSLAKSLLSRKFSERINAANKDTNLLSVNDAIPKSLKLRRSLSQGDQGSPRKFRQHRSRSIFDCPIIGQENSNESDISCLPSIIFEDRMNRAFLQTQLSNNLSFVSNLSNVSSIARLNSVSSGFNSSTTSSVFSNRTANCAFIENSTDVKLTRNLRHGSDGSVSSMNKSPLEETRDEKELDDLIAKYSKLRTKSSVSPIDEAPVITRKKSIICGSGIYMDELVSPKPEDKLIDVDVFVPASKESPSSTASSDSVFIDSSTMGKSIFLEAKNLAKTFAELAEKTSSSSSSLGDDLLNGRIHWNFDMLPPSDDEAPVDDLIELQKSPGNCNTENTKSPGDSEKSGSSTDAKSEKSMLKELEREFIEPEKKIIATTLLLDLEKIVKSEDNPEAAELLKSLEKALGISSNADLLATCLTERNDLTKSPRRIENVLGNENIKADNNEKSREDNSEVETSNCFKKLSLDEEKSLQNNLNIKKEINKSDKSLMLVSDEYDNSSNDKISPDEKEDSYDKLNDDSIEALKQHNQITSDQKMAVEILIGLGKLLTGDNKDPMTSSLLKNLGIALNLASSNKNDANEQAKNSKDNKRPGTPVKSRVATPPRKNSATSNFSRTANRRSFDSGTKGKTSVDRVMRRSISVTQTPTSTSPNIPRLANNPLSADKSKAHLKDARKRFSSDPSADVHTINARKSIKDITVKPVVLSEIVRQEKPSSNVIIGCVKNKFRKNIESDVASKKGPMKAIIPLGNMQRRGSLAKKLSPLNGSITPPKPGRETPTECMVTTSTPFPTVHLSIPKKTSKSKPIASSTPDDLATRRRSASQIPASPKKNSFPCSISPVMSKDDEGNDDNPLLNNSKSLKTSKIGTPAKSRSGSQLPKLSPMPITKASPIKSSRGQRRSEPLQSFLPRSQNTPKSPRERHVSDGSVSPLNNSNKIGSKVKPFNLISKLRKRSASTTEKENYA